MLVLLVSERDVLVDELDPPDGASPPTSLTFQGHDVEGPGGRLQPGPDLVYRLAGQVDLSAALTDRVEGELLEALRPLGPLPVYLELPPSTAEAFLAAQDAAHPSVGPGIPRPRLQLVPDAPAGVLGDFIKLGEEHGTHGAVPTFSVDGFAAALSVGGISEGMRIELAGHGTADGLYDVVSVVPADGGGVDARLRPVEPRPDGDLVVPVEFADPAGT